MRRFYIIFFLVFIAFKVSATGFSDSTRRTRRVMKEILAAQKSKPFVGFETNVYLKSTLILDQRPKRLLGVKLSNDINLRNHQLLWLYEAYSNLYYTPKNGFQEWIKATKSYGSYPSWEFKNSAQMQVDFRKSIIKLKAFSSASFISPLANNAFSFYDYEIDHTEDGDIYIRVKPKREDTPTFNGYLEIDGKTKQLKFLELKLSGDKRLNFIDTLKIQQKFEADCTLPTYTKFSYTGKVMKFKFSGESEAFFSAYQDIRNAPHEFGRLQSILDNGSDKNSALLDSVRIAPLTLQERISYEYQDDLKRQREIKSSSDSLDRLASKPKFLPLLFSDFVVENKHHNQALIFNPLIPAFFYNTVEGFGINYGVTFINYASSHKYLSVTPKIRYGLSSKAFNSDISLTWLYKPEKRGVLNISSGSTYLDLNPNGTLNSLQNTLNSLIFEQNFMKLYRKQYFSISSGREVLNNLYLSLGTEVSKNFAEDNKYDYTLRDIKERNFSSNNPLYPQSQTKLFPNYTSFFVNASLVYSFNQHYIMEDGEKIYKIPEGPRMILTYRKGIPKLFDSKSDYDYFEVELQQEKLDMGLWGYGSYSISGGRFFNVANVYYPEWRHFTGNLALVFNPGLKSFHLLNFYTYSTNQCFIEAHFEHNFNQHFSSQIPFMRNLKLEELVGGAFLYQPQKKQYYEAYIGLRRLMFRADYAMSFDSHGKLAQGFKISYDF